MSQLFDNIVLLAEICAEQYRLEYADYVADCNAAGIEPYPIHYWIEHINTVSPVDKALSS